MWVLDNRLYANAFYIDSRSASQPTWDRQIVPSSPGVVRVHAGTTPGHSMDAEKTGEQVKERNVVRWVRDIVPSLEGSFTPACGHLQTLFTVAGDFTKVDRVHYIRCVRFDLLRCGCVISEADVQFAQNVLEVARRRDDVSHGPGLENDWFNSRAYSSRLGIDTLRLFFHAYDRDPGPFTAEGSLVTEHIEKLEKQRKTMGVRSRLRKVDDLVVCKIGGKIGGPTGIGAWPFGSALEYYEWASPHRMLGKVKVPLLSINAFDDPVVDGASLPFSEFRASSHVYAAVTGSGGHLGWFDGPFFNKVQSKRRWVLKPVSEFLTAASRDLPLVGAAVEVEVEQCGERGEEKWEWVKEPAQDIPGLKRVGWRVVDEGEVVKGESYEGEEGLMQGL
ncbi:hypothetical protein IAT38_003073 [Cryptococcus sp. DSM 104549]